MRRRLEIAIPAAALAVVLLAAGGCQAINTAVFGFEREVDHLSVVIDQAGDEFLPSSGPEPGP